MAREGKAPPSAAPDLSGVVHDVSNMLTVVLGWLTEARSTDATEETVRYALAMADSQAQLARDLARRAIDGGASFSMEAEQLWEAVVDSTISALSVEASRKKVRVVREGDARGAPIYWPLDASQVLTNLVMNALAYSPAGSVVRVMLHATNEQVGADVIDEGPGVPEPRRKSIFEGESTRELGAGVGLRHSLAVAERRGGGIELLPSPKGACFRVMWARGDFIPPPPPSAPRPQLLAGMRVLVVEDDAAIIQLLESILDARGATVSVARTMEDVERIAAESAHDAVLTDLSPISKDIPRALTAIRRSSPEGRLVVITGSTDSLPEPLATNDIRVVKKPFAVSEVLDALLDDNNE